LPTPRLAFSSCINGGEKPPDCDGERRNDLKAIGSKFSRVRIGSVFVKLLKCLSALTVIAALAFAAAANAAERKSLDDPQWPNVGTDDDARWPNVRLDDLNVPEPRLNPRPSFIDPEEVTDRIMGRTARRSKPGSRNASLPEGADVTGSTARWPDVHVDETVAPAPRPNPHPSFADTDATTTGRVAGSSSRSAAKPSIGAVDTVPASDALAADVTGSAGRWPSMEPKAPLSPFVFEAGARYWYSTGSMKFNFTNNSPLFGSPTSTLFWRGMTGQSGEGFARIDHLPSGFFVKGMAGLGRLTDGNIVDEDFLANQFQFSSTTSDVSTGKTRFAMFDAGWAYWPVPDVRLGFFAGYHYWHEDATAFGLVCNQPSVLGCPAAGAVLLGNNVAVLRYEPTWHAMRVGLDTKYIIGDGWSVTGDFALVPYAALVNNDSHLLRQGIADLGPAPNVISRSTYAYGAEAEMFVNYAVTPNIEIGAGVRYWGLSATQGNVRFGPLFAERNNLNSFNEDRYGVLAHVKGTF
jgi:hypothetical protein